MVLNLCFLVSITTQLPSECSAQQQRKLIKYLLVYLLLTAKNPPAVQETMVRFLGWEDQLEKGKATHSSIMACRIPWTVHGVTKSQTWMSDFQQQQHIRKSRHITLPTQVPILKATVFPVVTPMRKLDRGEGWVPKNWCFWIGAGENSWESLGLQGDQASQS